MNIHIDRLIKQGIIAFSEKAEKEYDEENKDNADEKVEKVESSKSIPEVDNLIDDFLKESAKDTEIKESEEEAQANAWWDDSDVDNNDEDVSQYLSDDAYLSQNEIESDFKDAMLDGSPVDNTKGYNPVRKIQTVDIVSKVEAKYDAYISKMSVIDWFELIPTGKNKKNKLTYWNYVEDVHKLLNRTFGSQKFMYLDIYNKLFDKLSNSTWATGLNVYCAKNYGKPYITEGLYLLMYELTFDWTAFLIKFFAENPSIDANNFEDDSFVKKFHNLSLLTYISKLVTESEEFNKFMTDIKVFDMMKDDTEYNLTLKQVSSKLDMLKTSGESLTYFANLVNNNYADIVVGVLDKLGTVVFLFNNCNVTFSEKLSLINELIRSVSTRKPIQVSGSDSISDLTTMLKHMQTYVDKLILARQEALMLFESNKENFIIRISNSNEI